MIAKITRGQRVGDIAAYLHGPGKANEHQYLRDGRRHSGGMVIASNIGAEGATDPRSGPRTYGTRKSSARTSPSQSGRHHCAPLQGIGAWMIVSGPISLRVSWTRWGWGSIHGLRSVTVRTTSMWSLPVSTTPVRSGTDAMTADKHRPHAHASRSSTSWSRLLDVVCSRRRPSLSSVVNIVRLRRCHLSSVGCGAASVSSPRTNRDTLEPELQGVMRTTPPERVPGAYVRPRADVQPSGHRESARPTEIRPGRIGSR